MAKSKKGWMPKRIRNVSRETVAKIDDQLSERPSQSRVPKHDSVVKPRV